MCAVNDELCQARMEKVIAVESDILEVKVDMKSIIEITKKQDEIISKQITRIALIEQQLSILRWVSGTAIGAVIVMLVKVLWDAIIN